jgi:hypothetical protein
MDGDMEDPRRVFGLDSLGGGESRPGECRGPKALMMAVLEDAIRDYFSIGRLHLDAADWVCSERRDVFSFVVICETLGLEPTAVRRALTQSVGRSTLPLRRLRAGKA